MAEAGDEDHLDEVVQSLLDVKEAADWEVCGLSYKDTSLVKGFLQEDFVKAEPRVFLLLDGVDQSRNVVYIQNAMNKRFPEDVYGTGKRQRILICRHLLEHSHSPTILGSALAGALDCESILIAEIPIFERNRTT